MGKFGKIINIDLSTGRVEREEVTEDAVRISVNILLYSLLRKGGLSAGR